MINNVILFNLQGYNDMPAWERWYMRYHAPEVMARFEPWMMRYVSYRAVPAPEEAEVYGYYNYRLTQAWFREMPGPPNDALSYDNAKGVTAPPQFVLFNIPPQATEDFMGGDATPDDKNILRWITIFKYPDGVSIEEGDDWYVNVHAKEVMKQPGLTRYFSFRTIPMQGPLPGWKPLKDGSSPLPPPIQWCRVSELWYENFNGWRKSVIEAPPTYTKPAWAKHDKYPFLEPHVNFVSTFILERPTNDFLRELRGYI